MAISHCLLTDSGQEWQFHMSTDMCKDGNSRMAISHTCLLTCSGQEWQFHIVY